eukprot:gene7815-9283_t
MDTLSHRAQSAPSGREDPSRATVGPSAATAVGDGVCGLRAGGLGAGEEAFVGGAQQASLVHAARQQRGAGGFIAPLREAPRPLDGAGSGEHAGAVGVEPPQRGDSERDEVQEGGHLEDEDELQVSLMQEELERRCSLLPGEAEGVGGKVPARTSPSVWVCKWVDYSSKYGVGYQLSDGACGVVFNDGSKIVQAAGPGGRLEYRARARSRTDRVQLSFTTFERRDHMTLACSPDKAHPLPIQEEVMMFACPEEAPPSMQKKVVLLAHFRSYLERRNKGRPPLAPATDARLHYVKKWLKTNHAIIFRLSNKTIQVDFNDSTEIVLSSESRCVTYVNKELQRVTYSLSDLPQQADLLKRLKYTKEILLQLINRQK